jgi:hypothetical protein
VQIRFPQSARRHFEMQATTNLFDSTSWWPLDVPGNRPFCSSSIFEVAVEDEIVESEAMSELKR